MITFITQFRHYLLGQKFILCTDHNSLRWLFSFKDPQGQIARWLEVLSQYDFEIQLRKGKQHQNADALSRKPLENENLHSECKEFEENIDNVTDLGKKVRTVTRSQTTSTIVSCP